MFGSYDDVGRACLALTGSRILYRPDLVEGRPRASENFMIKFQNEEGDEKVGCRAQPATKGELPQANASPDRPPPTFTWMSSQTSGLENPHRRSRTTKMMRTSSSA